jgi:hypothetical protein
MLTGIYVEMSCYVYSLARFVGRVCTVLYDICQAQKQQEGAGIVKAVLEILVECHGVVSIQQQLRNPIHLS